MLSVTVQTNNGLKIWIELSIVWIWHMPSSNRLTVYFLSMCDVHWYYSDLISEHWSIDSSLVSTRALVFSITSKLVWRCQYQFTIEPFINTKSLHKAAYSWNWKVTMITLILVVMSTTVTTKKNLTSRYATWPTDVPRPHFKNHRYVPLYTIHHEGLLSLE